MSDITIEDIKSYLQGRAKHPIMSVSGIDDPDYKTMRDFVLRVKPNTEDYMHSISSGMNSMLSGMSQRHKRRYNRQAYVWL